MVVVAARASVANSGCPFVPPTLQRRRQRHCGSHGARDDEDEGAER